MDQHRRPKGTSTGGQFAARHRVEEQFSLADTPGAEQPRPSVQNRLPEAEYRQLVKEVTDARSAVRAADRRVREAMTAHRRSFEFPPLKALANRRLMKAREKADVADRELSTLEKRLRDSGVE